MPGTVNSYPPSTAELGSANSSVRNCVEPGSPSGVQIRSGPSRVAVVVEPRMHLDHEPGVVVAVVVEHDVGRASSAARVRPADFPS